jgi:hypothetical protein
MFKLINTLSIITLAFLNVFIGCSNSVRYKINYDPTTTLKVAVLPFLHDGFQAESPPPTDNLIVDSLPLFSENIVDSPPRFLRNLVQNELIKTNIQLVTPSLVELELPHHGYAKDNGEFDLKKIAQVDAKDLCSHLLYCDAVLIGEVSRWNRSYYGLESVVRVGLKLKLISAIDNKIIYTAEAEDYKSRGISKIPTGFADLVIEPLRGLDSEIISDLARDVVKSVINPISLHVRDAKKFTEIPLIYAASYTPKIITPDTEEIVFLAYASPNKVGKITLSNNLNFTTEVPLQEVASGHYVGYFYPNQKLDLTKLKVKVTIGTDISEMSELEIASVN